MVLGLGQVKSVVALFVGLVDSGSLGALDGAVGLWAPGVGSLVSAWGL